MIAARLKLIVTKLEKMREIGNIYLGIYIFFINDAFHITDVIAMELLSEKKPNSV